MKFNKKRHAIVVSVVSVNLFFSLIECSSSKFQEFDIVPQIIPSAPKQLLQITYQNKFQVHLGNALPPAVCAKPPVVKWKAEPEKFYLLTMIDANFPTGLFPQLFHWIIGNIPGNDVTNGEVLASYVSPMPLYGTGEHRYVFFIFEQPGKLAYTKNLFLLRVFPSLRTALEFYNIDSHPLAGNFFLSESF